MIVHQSTAIVESSSHWPCHSPSPGGSNERSECRFVCCSGVGGDEGELCYRGRQSALIKVGEHGTRSYSRTVLKSFSVPRLLCVLCDSVAKYDFPTLAYKILNPFQGCPSPSKPFQDPREGGGSVVHPKSLRHTCARLTH